MPRHRLRGAVWASLHAKLGTIPGIWKTDATALRWFVEAVIHVLRTGIAWEAVVDVLSRPLCFLLTPGQAADCRQARPLVEGLSFEHLIGDRGYDTDEVRDWVEEHDAEAVIPSKRNRKTPIPHNRQVYKGRHKVEASFAGSKISRALSYASTRPHAATLASSASPSPPSTSNSVGRP